MQKCKIAERLAELRASRGLTQSELARKLSISNKTISKWENGISTPDLPMLIELSTYYGVSTDALLGLEEIKKKSAEGVLGSNFKRSECKDAELQMFDTVRTSFPMLFATLCKNPDDAYLNEKVLPTDPKENERYKISRPEFFEMVTSTENTNLAVMMLRNKNNFSWMNDRKKQSAIVRLFKFLSSEETLSVLYFIHSTACSESFTADYIAKNTGIDEARVIEILDEFCGVGDCSAAVAHLAGGEVKMYKTLGDGMILALISLAFERTCGGGAWGYNFRGKCKMIGGE